MHHASPSSHYFLWALLFIFSSGCYSSPEGLADRGEEALRAFKMEEAETAFQGALDREPTMPRALYGLGWIYFSQGDNVRARLYFERCLRADPRFYGCHRGMGSLHMSMGFALQAEESLERANQLKPGDASVLSSLGHLYLSSDRLDMAGKKFEEVLRVDPDRGETYFGLAELRFAQGRLKETVALLDEAAKHPLGEVKFHELMGELRARALAGLASASPDRTEARQLYGLAIIAVDGALETAVLEKKHRLWRLRKQLVGLEAKFADQDAALEP